MPGETRRNTRCVSVRLSVPFRDVATCSMYGGRGRHDHFPSTCNHMFQRALSASLPSNTKLTSLISAKPSASVGSSYALSNPASTLLGSSPRAGCGLRQFPAACASRGAYLLRRRIGGRGAGAVDVVVLGELDRALEDYASADPRDELCTRFPKHGECAPYGDAALLGHVDVVLACSHVAVGVVCQDTARQPLGARYASRT